MHIRIVHVETENDFFCRMEIYGAALCIVILIAERAITLGMYTLVLVCV